MRFHIDKSKAPKFIVDGKTYYFFMPISKLACLVVNDNGKKFVYYHFHGLNMTAREHPTASMPCQALCGHNLKRFHWSCLNCGYRKSFYGKMPRLLEIKMIYQIYIPHGVRHERIKDAIRKFHLTLAESVST